MADKLLIRVFDVGLGDCIYCRIPKARQVDGAVDDFHLLIDCGSWSGSALLEAALANLATLLPETGDGRRRLDLLVITHEHKDHIAGCDPALFRPFRIGAIWMNAAMDPDHAQASGTHKLHAFAARAMRGIAGLNLALSPEMEDIVGLFGIDNDGAMAALREGLPAASGIKPSYVHAGQTGAELGLPLAGAEIHVLGPENDIDGFYLGRKAGASVQALAGDDGAGSPGPVGTADAAVAAAAPLPAELPDNIGAAEFRQLRSRMVSSAFAFASLSSKVTNNSSVVLLIEWHELRLLFVGDAEWDETFSRGKANGAWNVMWSERRAKLGQPVHFLKIGHHGSENATPWDEHAAEPPSEPAAILDAILPLPAAGEAARAVAVVSTERGKYKTIPRAQLLTEIGRRVASPQNYEQRLATGGLAPKDLPKFEEFEAAWISKPQPWRTDIERRLTGRGFIDVELEA